MTSRFTLPNSVRAFRALTLAAGALLTSAAIAQDSTTRVRPENDTATNRDLSSAALAALSGQARLMLDSSPTTLLFDERHEGALWARGANFKASFGAEGATIVPFFGSDAPRNFPLEFGASTATLAGEALDVRPASVKREGATVRIDRGALVEEYDLTNCSLEQRFVFQGLPSSGELVVRIPTKSELQGLDFGETLRFENELGAIDYGQAFALDATGARITLDSVLVNGAIELRVPAGFVGNARFPLVIDPMITFHTVSGSSLHEVEPDVAYDASTDRWCIVFSSIWSQTDYDCFARLATGDYTLLPGLITIDFTTDLWATPKIANNNATNRFLVANTFVPAQGPADIRGVFVDPSSAQAGNPFFISPQDGAYRNWPDVGGDTVHSGATNYFVVWQRPVSQTDCDIEGRTVGADGSLGPIVLLEGGSSMHILPSISNTLGRNGSLITSVWTVAWLKQNSLTNRDVYAAQVAWNGALVTPMFPVATSQLDETNVSVSTLLDPTDSASSRAYAVVFDRDYGPDRDVIASVLVGNQVLVESNIVGMSESTHWYRDQRAPSVDSDGQHFVIGFSEYATKTSVDGNVYVGDYYFENGTLHGCEPRAVVGGSPTDEQDVSIYAMGASVGERGFYLAVFDYLSASNGYDIVAAYYRGCDNKVESVCGSIQAQVPCPCGLDGEFGNGCANSVSAAGGRLVFEGAASVSGNTARFVASNLPANVSCLFFQGSSMSSPVPFGSGLRCATGTTIRIGLAPADAAGAASYPNQGQAGIAARGLLPTAGGTRYYQAWYRDPQSACSLKSNLTNALGVTWAP